LKTRGTYGAAGFFRTVPGGTGDSAVGLPPTLKKDTMMKFPIIAALLSAVVALSACQPTPQNQAIAGGVFGAAAGLVGAEMLDANPQWTAVAVLAGAAAGTLIAQNQATRECAYSDGRGGYYTRPC
jgi:hypothetical protein